MAIKLTIYRRYFRDSSCYKNAPMQPVTGVQVHSTGANNPWLRRYVQPDDGRIGVNPNGNSHNRPDGNVCANAYIGKQADGTVAVYQALPWEQRCWLSGSGPRGNANRLGYAGFEICEDGLEDARYFREAMAAAERLTAWLCLEYRLDPEQDVRDHSELHGLGLASDHGDIAHWLKRHGQSMDDFRANVAAMMAQGVEAQYIDCDEVKIMYEARAACTGVYLNLRSGPGKMYEAIAPIPRGDTVQVLEDSGDWWRVMYHGMTGYAMASYLEKMPEEDAEPEQAVPEGMVMVPAVKLVELEACLADALAVIRQIKGGG